MKTVLIASTILLAISASAVAADIAAYEPTPATPVDAFTWTGGYIGAQTGYVWGDGRFDGNGDHANPKPDGLTGGLYAGVGHQFDSNIVASLEADMAWSGADASALVYNSAGVPWPADFPVVQKINLAGAVRARLGYAMARWLPYVAGGVALAAVDQRLVGADGDFNTTYTGWTLGLGTEYSFTDNLIFRAEYRYADFGSKTFTVQNAPPLGIGPKTNDVRLGIAYKF